MHSKIISLRWLLLSLLFSLSTSVFATGYSNPDIERLLRAPEAPDGVVIELLSWDEQTWNWAAPMITDLRQQLLEKFPDTDVAVVSHGGEQFQLTRDRAQEQPEAIAQLSALSEQGVDLHVCGTHSSWRDVPDTAYIDIVDVSPSGPAQINDYIKLGYRHIQLQRPME